MAERLSKLGVTQEAIKACDEYSNPFEDDIPSFIKGISRRIWREQPELYGYIKLSAQHYSGIVDLLAYGLGVSLTYDILPRSHTQRPLTTSEISAMHHTLVEHASREEQEDKQKAVIELSWFIDKLEEDSSIFIDWLQDSLEQIESMEGKKSFILGAIHVAMPFYMREEAKEMEHVLFKDDEVKE